MLVKKFELSFKSHTSERYSIFRSNLFNKGVPRPSGADVDADLEEYDSGEDSAGEFDFAIDLRFRIRV
jgi:hypothetical protein